MTIDPEACQLAAQLAYVETGFIRPADHNYVLARIAFQRGLPQEGYWEAAQALEKYLKASLLLGGATALQGHSYPKMVEAHERIWPALLDAPLPDSTPEQSPVHVHRGGPDNVRAFLDRIGYFGSPDNRYTRTGFAFDYLEVNKLDFVALLVRSTCRRPGSIQIGIDWRLDGYLPIEGWADDRSSRLSMDFFEGNAVWSAVVTGKPAQVGRQPMIAYQASALHSALNRLDEKEPGPQTAWFIEWLLSNVHFSRDDKLRLKAHVARIGAEPTN